jgi:hypothetical protein
MEKKYNETKKHEELFKKTDVFSILEKQIDCHLELFAMEVLNLHKNVERCFQMTDNFINNDINNIYNEKNENDKKSILQSIYDKAMQNNEKE